MSIKTLILKTAGINCDEELAHAFMLAGSDAEIVHINEFARGERKISEFDILGFPGGFSYGDDLSAGRVLATEVIARLLEEILNFYQTGGLIIGICNGFQVLIKARLLPDPEIIKSNPDDPPRCTLFWNDSGKFEDRWVSLKGNRKSNCVWTQGMTDVVEFPVAHAEGKFIPGNETILRELIANEQVVFTYMDPSNPGLDFDGKVPYPLNPNGSTANIAGICDRTGRVLGLMPHPERHTHRTNHPQWTRNRDESLIKVPDGLPLFENAVNYVKEKKGVKA